MSEVITGLLKLTIGLISDKVRVHSAEKLQHGGLTAQKFRGWIVSELDDMKSKLDSMSRTDLFTSISCLRQGIDRLSISLGECSDSGHPSTSVLKCLRRRLSPGICSTKTKPAQQSATLENAVALANAIGKLKIVSKERLELAKRSFEEAGREARRAFHNAALSPEERILASKVRIASGILQHLEDPDFAAIDCLQSLRELNELPAIQEIFTVHYNGGIKAMFKKESRSEIVETVTMINLILADFITRFTERRMAVFDWPMIKCGKLVVHPIHHDQTDFPNLKEMKIAPPWTIVVPNKKLYQKQFRSQNVNSLTKSGDLVCFEEGRRGLQKLDTRTGKLQPMKVNSKYHQPMGSDVIDITVDEDDTVYVLSGNGEVGHTLSVYCANGRNIRQCTLKFLAGLDCYNITVTRDKNIVIFCKPGGKNIMAYLCNCDGELVTSFCTFLRKEDHVIESVYFSRNNEIILVTKKQAIADVFNDSYMLYIYEENGRFQKTVKFRPSEGDDPYDSILYNQVTKNIIGQFREKDDQKIWIEYLCDQTAERQCSHVLYDTNFPKSIFAWGWDFHVVCHTDGALALVMVDHLILLKNPSRQL